MDQDTLKTLALALGRLPGLGLPVPSVATPFLFLNAWPLPGTRLPPGSLVCEQGYRPVWLDLAQAGYEPLAELGEGYGEFAGALVAVSRNRRANEAMIGRASALVRPGSPVVVCGALRDGVKALRKSLPVAPVGNISKHHAVAFVLIAAGAAPVPPDAPSPMMFSAGWPDPGSALLASHFDGRIAGKVADFGAGAGYLCAQLLERCPDISELCAVEADWQSLKLARRVLAAAGADRRIAFEWLDLLREQPAGRFDWVIMNPPFHLGRAAEPAIGQAFVRAAASVLKARGRLLMVANRRLPYEAALGQAFSRVACLADSGGYKIIEAAS